MSLFCSSCGVENSVDAVICKGCSAKLARPNAPLQGEIVDDHRADGKGFAGSLPLNILLAVACAIYLINPGMGLVEFLPDALPIIGNIDEASATAGLLFALSNLGLIPWARKT